jgi:hypothetical protein
MQNPPDDVLALEPVLPGLLHADSAVDPWLPKEHQRALS